MEIISKKRCIIGEGPIWNEKEGLLYFTNSREQEICVLDIYTKELKIIPTEVGGVAIAFDKSNRMIVSRRDGIFYLEDNIATPLYDTNKHQILHGNDMKVGPDGRIYVGTQSSKRLGLSNNVDGKLYSIDKDGNVRTLLDALLLSNGMDWSMDETRFYHTDSATRIIKEYLFDKVTGDIEFTDKSVYVQGVDGFTIDENDLLYVACWGQGHIAVVDTRDMTVIDHIDVPAKIPASCAFAGKGMNELVVVTADYKNASATDEYAGYTFKKEMSVCGRLPYLFG
ncbi:MAG: SMP-30/gluconolactonase/LRE family protein [Ruminococcaceae bacterium]|nr:SMP-30/gluconolactonase/LRE family protein [Oscillospiraceae bacterium]